MLCLLQEESKLLVANAAKFKKWFNVDVLENTEVTNIDRQVRETHKQQLAALLFGTAGRPVQKQCEPRWPARKARPICDLHSMGSGHT